jgi:hypothetical protein
MNKTAPFLVLVRLIVGMNVLTVCLTSHVPVWADETESVSAVDGAKTKHYLRAAAETIVLLGLDSAYYWSTRDYEANFDYDLSLETLRKKLSGEAISFEDNGIETNGFPGHPIAGAGYYLIPRNHNLSTLESFLWNLAASSIHELFIEYAELFSINDTITTTVAGSSIGEAAYHISRYLRCSQNRHRFINKIMGALTDPIALINSIVWDDVHFIASEADACNYTTIQSEFGLFSGINTVHYQTTDRVKTGLILGFYAKIYPLSSYGKPSDISRFVTDTILVDFGLDLTFTNPGSDKIEDALNSVNFVAKTVWLGYLRQKIMPDVNEEVTGYSFFMGLASAYNYIKYETGAFKDWIGAVHLGPSLELTVFEKNNYLRMTVDIFSDFGLVRPFALENYKKDHTLEGTKSVLVESNYYYALGFTVNPKIEIRYKSYRFLADYKYSYYDSIEGLDRKEPLANDFNLIDTRLALTISLGRQIDFIDWPFFTRQQVWVEAEVRHIARTGFIADDEVTHDGSTTWFMLRFKVLL